MVNLFSLLAAAATASAVTLRNRDTTCNAGPTTVNGRQCTIECGIDHPAGDYKSLAVANLQACVNACGQDLNCFTAQYSVANSYCYLKNHDNPATNATGINGVVCQTTPICTPGNVTINGRAGYIECGIDHPGGDEQGNGNSNDSLEQCEANCASDPACISAQWTIDSQVCYRKSSLTPSVTNNNVNGIVFLSAPGSPTPTPNPGCAPVAPASPYIVNAGFESLYIGHGPNPWGCRSVSGIVSCFTQYNNSFEGCWSMHMRANSDTSVTREMDLTANITSLQPGSLYNLSFRLGHQNVTTYPGPSPYVNTFIDGQQILQSPICGVGNSPACQFNATASYASGSLVTTQFTPAGNRSLMSVNFIWPPGAINTEDIIIDDFEVSPAS